MADEQLDALKIPPHSVEAEQSVIGGLLLENEALDKIADILSPNDFYRHDHKLIFQHIGKLIEHNRPADIVTVAESLELSLIHIYTFELPSNKNRVLKPFSKKD